MIHKEKLGRSFLYALEGIQYAFMNNQNMRIHFFAAVAAVITSLILRISYIEMIIVGLTIMIALSAEMINTAIEQMTDLIVQEHRMEAKIAKDVAAGMVLVTATCSVIVALLIFTPYILRLI